MAMVGWMGAGMELVLGKHAGQSQVVGRMSGDAGAIQWHGRDCDNWLSGWLQHRAEVPEHREPPVRGQHSGFISSGAVSPWGVAVRKPEGDF